MNIDDLLITLTTLIPLKDQLDNNLSQLPHNNWRNWDEPTLAKATYTIACLLIFYRIPPTIAYHRCKNTYNFHFLEKFDSFTREKLINLATIHILSGDLYERDLIKLPTEA